MTPNPNCRTVTFRRRALGLVIAFGMVLACAAGARSQGSPPPSAHPGSPVVQAVGAIGITVSDLDRAIEFYFKDPDGHVLEILQFPPGKGDPKWQRATDRLFLGIDHTAIVAADTDASLKFHRDILGLKVVGESENYGPEQERLNNVFGAHLRITTLRAGAGPAIELLEYLAPRDGRPYPADARANDLWRWQTHLAAADAAAALPALRAARSPLISPGLVETPDRALGIARGFMVRDPDGHAVQLVER